MASAHIITTVIGSGVLSLAWTVAQLGWITGSVVMILFSIVTYYTSILLADGYRYLEVYNNVYYLLSQLEEVLKVTTDKTYVSTRMMGKYGHCATDYAMIGQLTFKLDIYSFGVVQLELWT